LHNEVAVGVHEPQVLPKPILDARFGNLSDLDTLPLILIYGSVAQDQPHRLQHLTSSKARLRPPGHEQPLVDIVV
jgi:hypothetical protein